MTGNTTIDLGAILGQAALFGGLGRESRAVLARETRLVECRKGAFLFREGDEGGAAFLLLEGGIQLLKHAAGGQDVVVKTVAPGELFGEVVLFEQDRYPVSAVAVGPSRLARIPSAALRRLLDDAAFRSDFLRAVMGRMRYLAERILTLTAYDAEERLFRFLEEHYGRRETYRLTLSNKALAAAVGVTPETLSRLKERLVAAGDVEWAGRRLRVVTRR